MSERAEAVLRDCFDTIGKLEIQLAEARKQNAELEMLLADERAKVANLIELYGLTID